MQNIIDTYLATWNANRTQRQNLLTKHWSPTVTYVDPHAEIHGHQALYELIDAVQAQFPDSVFRQLSQADGHHQQVRFTWGLGPAGQQPIAVGFDVIVLDTDGRIHDVRGFLDPVPSDSAGPGYVVGHLRNVALGVEIQQYMESVESTFEPFDGQWLVHGNGSQPEVLEGQWSADTVIIRFPSRAAARDWYWSPAYQDILDLRTQNAESEVMLLKGVPSGYKAADTIAKLFSH